VLSIVAGGSEFAKVFSLYYEFHLWNLSKKVDILGFIIEYIRSFLPVNNESHEDLMLTMEASQ
jgi:hypothetical protein